MAKKILKGALKVGGMFVGGLPGLAVGSAVGGLLGKSKKKSKTTETTPAAATTTTKKGPIITPLGSTPAAQSLLRRRVGGAGPTILSDKLG